MFSSIAALARRFFIVLPFGNVNGVKTTDAIGCSPKDLNNVVITISFKLTLRSRLNLKRTDYAYWSTC